MLQTPGKNCLRGADDDASRLQLGFHAVSAEVAFGGGVEIGIDVEGVIGAGLHATLAADTSLIVKIDDSVGASVEGVGGADGNAGSFVTVVTSQHAEMAAAIGKLTLFHLLIPSAKTP